MLVECNRGEVRYKMRDIAVDIIDLTKRYGAFTALENVSLDIRDNEFFTLLGPSGCGKTTLLRCIAGFEDVTTGAIRLYGEDIADLPPNKRPVNTVFQNYALFPHMNVTQNIMFGLLQLGQDDAQARARTGDVLEMVQLTEFATRLPAQLSGGQQQRVALARALAPNPKVLLLDEPLSALDLKLRQAVRLELQQLQRETGITFVFVTHDQEEALTMSDRIAVIADGHVQQVGNARDIYQAPVNKFVANFIGETNLIDVAVRDVSAGKATCELPGGASFTCPAAVGATVGKGHLSVRPERVGFANIEGALLRGTVTRQVFLGTDMQVEVRMNDGGALFVRVQNSEDSHIPAVGEDIGLNFEAGAARLLVD
jgi:spermidine/putrescine transport system ATP-binding protein